MTDTTRTPWHLWAVGAVSLAWNAFGAYDYTMSHLQPDTYLAGLMSAEQIAYYNAMPPWTHAAWAFGVWGALAGSVLLLLRSRFAVHAFAISLAGLLASLVYNYALTTGYLEVMGPSGPVMNGVILAACLFFVWYAWSQRARLR